jgi:hypothetical protein
MNTRNRLLTAALASSLAGFGSSAAMAGGAMPMPPTPTPNTAEDTETEVFAGARWTFGKSLKPELLAGVRSAEIDSTGDVKGLQASISYDLATMGLGKLRFEALKGNETTQALLGVGYDFSHGAPLLGLGARGNHVFGGVDFLWGPNVPEFYVGLDTLGSLDEPDPTCDAGIYGNPYEYDSATGSCVPEGPFMIMPEQPG